MHGDDVCRRVVADGATSRVLMLTAAGTVQDRVDGLAIGADDYLPKPFDFSELVARVRALGRRSAAAAAAHPRGRRPDARPGGPRARSGPVAASR